MDTGDQPTTLRQRAENVWQRLRLRRREPWSWLAQTFFAGLLPPGLLFHSWPLCALSLVGFAASCRSLPLPPMEHTGAKRLLPLIETLIGLESAWLAEPMGPRKKRRIWIIGVGAVLTAILLWRQDLGPIGLAMAAFALWRVRRKNIEQGIDP